MGKTKKPRMQDWPDLPLEELRLTPLAAAWFDGYGIARLRHLVVWMLRQFSPPGKARRKQFPEPAREASIREARAAIDRVIGRTTDWGDDDASP